MNRLEFEQAALRVAEFSVFQEAERRGVAGKRPKARLEFAQPDLIALVADAVLLAFDAAALSDEKERS